MRYYCTTNIYIIHVLTREVDAYISDYESMTSVVNLAKYWLSSVGIDQDMWKIQRQGDSRVGIVLFPTPIIRIIV